MPHWFALNEDRPLCAFAGIWRPWTGERQKEWGEHRLFAFLTCDANDVVRPGLAVTYVPKVPFWKVRDFNRLDPDYLGVSRNWGNEDGSDMTTRAGSGWENTDGMGFAAGRNGG